jgi:dihydropteroate synthase
MNWHLRDRILTFERRALVMGIVNVTPDSFSDGGLCATTEAAIARGLELAAQGADILDIGGESTRPGATPVPLDEELRRVVPVVAALAQQTNVPLSIDTYKAEVARACLDSGAQIVNDVTALTGAADMLQVARAAGAGVILMHMQGTPATMQIAPHYDDVVNDIADFLSRRLQDVVARGLAPEKIALDPGVGFGKTHQHNLEIVARLAEFQRLGPPICLGASRKGFIGKITGRPLEERMVGSVAIVCHALAHQAAQIVRVHDVAQTRDAVLLFVALRNKELEIRSQKSEARSRESD